MRTRQPPSPAVALAVMAVLIAVLWASHSLPHRAMGQNAAKTSEAKNDVPDAKAIRALVAQLGDSSFELREAAAKRLRAIGEPALDLLEKSALESTDPEVRYSAGLLVGAISKGLFS